MLIRLVLLFGTFLLMEGTAWFTHKYIMHGFMWCWHRSHHVHHNEVLEKNDLFAIVFSSVSIITIGLGNFVPELWYLFWIGMGVTLYGVFYFIFHDIIVHRRIKIKFVAKHPYLKRIMKAHYIHHKVHEREGAEAFGFLYAPKKYEDTRK
ncbi:sterol desaturase family protein [Arcicella aquatica]|uniref:Sterol desaturase family protein n=1 Tax=Arcicella aquatica TaxID=217141 RepID=A0ABU5QSA9_9BACT|nr:beta-carotene hydroxylase [Arcicella aquatica]MEA5259878.1 sterol desaturase family protein [Arcicella aquatica]